MKSKRYEEKKRSVRGKIIIGVDPGMDRHQLAVIDEIGEQAGKSFSVAVSHEGFEEKMMNKLGRLVGEFDDLVFAVESSCNLWQTLCAWLSFRGTKWFWCRPLLQDLHGP